MFPLVLLLSSPHNCCFPWVLCTWHLHASNTQMNPVVIQTRNPRIRP
jgi:hypothetical protein